MEALVNTGPDAVMGSTVIHKEFRSILREGVNRPYLLAEGQKAVEYLMTVGFQDVVLVDPGNREIYLSLHNNLRHGSGSGVSTGTQ